jgi:signal peptidase I
LAERRRSVLDAIMSRIKTPRLKSAASYLWKEWLRPLAVTAAFLLPVKSSLADWNWVPTGSMKPTILEGDLVGVNKS